MGAEGYSERVVRKGTSSGNGRVVVQRDTPAPEAGILGRVRPALPDSHHCYVKAGVDFPRLPDPITPIPPELSSMLCDYVLY